MIFLWTKKGFHSYGYDHLSENLIMMYTEKSIQAKQTKSNIGTTVKEQRSWQWQSVAIVALAKKVFPEHLQ